MINITEVKIHSINDKNGKLLGRASIVIDGSFVVNDINIIQGKDDRFISFPSRKNTSRNQYFDIAHPINQEQREAITKTILDAYDATMSGEDQVAESE